MGKTHKEQAVLVKEIEAAKRLVAIGARYHHYKGEDKIYTVLGIGIMEEDNELYVMYRAEYGEKLTFLRPVNVWLEAVEWQGEKLPRFTKL